MPPPSDSSRSPESLRFVRRGYRLATFGLYSRGGVLLRRGLAQLEERSGDAPYAHGLMWLGAAQRCQGQLALAMATHRDAAGRLAEHGEPELAALCLAWASDAACAVEGPDQAAAVIDAAAVFRASRPQPDTVLARAIVASWRGSAADAAVLAGGVAARTHDRLGAHWAHLWELEAEAETRPEAINELVKLAEEVTALGRVDELVVRAWTSSARAAVRQAGRGKGTGPEVARAWDLACHARNYSLHMPRYAAWATWCVGAVQALQRSGPLRASLAQARAYLQQVSAPVEEAALLAAYVVAADSAALPERGALRAEAHASLTDRGALGALRQLGERVGTVSAPRGGSLSVVGLRLDEGVELQALLEVNRLVSSILQVPDLLRGILTQAVKLLQAQRGAFLLRRPDASLECVAAHHLEPQEVREGNDAISFGVIQACQSSARPVLADNAQTDSRFAGRQSILAGNIRSVLCAPLLAPQGMLGVLYLDSSLQERVFTQHSLELLTVFCTQAAVALVNARAFGEIEQLNRDLESRVQARTVELLRANVDLEATLEHLRSTEMRLLAAQRDALEAEMRVARGVQEAAMPSSQPHRLAAACVVGRLQPAAVCGGDFWTFRQLPDDRLLLLVADVTGHGMGAAMLTTAARAVLETTLQRDPGLDVDALLEALSAAILASTAGRTQMTAAICICNPASRTLRYSSAGHNAPLLLKTRQGAASCEALHVVGHRLGDAQGTGFVTRQTAYAANDCLILYSDGLIERPNADGRLYGTRRLSRTILANATRAPAALVDLVLDDVASFGDKTPPADDITLVAAHLA